LREFFLQLLTRKLQPVTPETPFFSHVPQIKIRRTTVVITEVRIKLMEDNNERLQAFCSVTFDDAFVVRDLKIIEGTKGSFVAMPSRKLTDRCQHCGSKNHLRARFCNQCGSRLDEDRATRDSDGRAKLHADIAHPINSACREVIQTAVLRAFQEERERSKQPGYICRYDDYDMGDFEESFTNLVGEMNGARSPQPEGYRTHAPHQGPRNSHAASNGQEVKAESKREFGSGIL
jgi:stage V sporulation protein G